MGEEINRRRLLRLSGAGVVAAGSAGVAASRARARRRRAPPPSFIILACDGGGVRGLITAMLLQNLNPQFLQKVSLFAGTSTGSIIALGLAAGLPIGQIVQLYSSMADCQTIFTPYLSAEELRNLRSQVRAALAALPPASGTAAIDWQKILQLVLRAVEEMAYPKYQSTGLRTLLTANLPALTLAELASQTGKYVVVPSFQINNGSTTASWKPVLFHNLPGLAGPADLGATTLVDTAMCSAAAPLFFPPHDLVAGAFVDGGLSANNPCSAAIAAVLASSLTASGGIIPESIAAVSIGTGNVTNSYPPSDAVFPFGILGWMWPYEDAPAPATPLIQAMFAGSSGIDDLVASMLLRDSTYIRVNPLFDQTWSLDDCSAIAQMTTLTRTYLHTAEWKNFARQINALAA